MSPDSVSSHRIDINWEGGLNSVHMCIECIFNSR